MVAPLASPRPTRHLVARALSWTALESFGLSGLSFLTLVVLAHYLAPGELGLASMALGIVQVLNIPVEMLFHDALVQRPQLQRRHFDSAFVASLLLGLALWGVCRLGAEAMARALSAPQMAPVLRSMSLSLPAMGLGSVLIAQQRRALQYRPLALRSLVGRLAGALVAIGLAVSGAGVWSLVAQQVVSVALATLTLWLFCEQRPRLRLSLPALRELLGFGLSATSVTAMYFIVPRWFMLLTGSQLGAGAAGYLNLAFRTVDSVRDVAAGAVSQLALPIFARFQHQGGELRASFNGATTLTCALMFPVFASLAVLAPQAVQLVFGARWLPAAPLVSLLSVLAFYYFARMFAPALMSAVRKPHYPLAGQAAQLALITAAMLALPQAGLWPIGLVWAARLAVSAPLDIALMRRATGLSPRDQLQGLAAPALAAATLGAAGLAVRNALAHRLPDAALLLAAGTAGVLAYLATLVILDAPLLRRLAGFGRLALGRHEAAPEVAAAPADQACPGKR